ncbi:hypothetical protein [Nocardia salmonicida]|uniref:hypothetical protein n=1 Tax=Nocardia salmonicida TaxID=53431 RepID=UPI0033D2826C
MRRPVQWAEFFEQGWFLVRVAFAPDPSPSASSADIVGRHQPDDHDRRKSQARNDVQHREGDLVEIGREWRISRFEPI